MALDTGVADLVYDQSAEIAKWVAQNIPDIDGQGFDGPVAAIGVATDRIIAGVVFHDYQKQYGTIQLSMAATSPMWARQEIIKGLLAYPFYQLDCFKIWTATSRFNDRALKVNKHVGFTQEAVLAHQFGKQNHAVVMRMLRPDFEKRYGEN